MWKLKLNTSFINKCYYYHHYTLEMKILELYALDLKKKNLTQSLNQCRDVYSIGLTASCPIAVKTIIYAKLISVQFEQMLSSIKLTSTLFLCPEDSRWCRIKVDLEYFWPLTLYITSWRWESFEKIRRDWSYFPFLLLHLVVTHLKLFFRTSVGHNNNSVSLNSNISTTDMATKECAQNGWNDS